MIIWYLNHPRLTDSFIIHMELANNIHIIIGIKVLIIIDSIHLPAKMVAFMNSHLYLHFIKMAIKIIKDLIIMDMIIITTINLEKMDDYKVCTSHFYQMKVLQAEEHTDK